MFLYILDDWQFILYSTFVFFLVWILYLIIAVAIHIICFAYGFLRLFQLSCYTRITLEWLPFINPYNWPFWIFYTLTEYYLILFNRIFPNIKLKAGVFEISTLLGLEAVNFSLYTCTLLLEKAGELLQEEFFLRRFHFFQEPFYF